MAAAKKLFIIAGEASGDLLASHLIQALRAKLPDAVFYGIGGPKMTGQGFDAWYPLEKLAVLGYVDALRHYREIVGIRRQLTERLLRDKPDAFIGVDAPDFNLDLEAALKVKGIKTVHFVSPAVWAVQRDAVRQALTPQTKILVLNSPSNPTGAVMDAARLQAIGQLALEKNLIVIMKGDGIVLSVDPLEHMSPMKSKLICITLYSLGHIFYYGDLKIFIFDKRKTTS